MQFIPMEIPEVILIIPVKYADKRGYFMETWQSKIFAENGIDLPFVQDNLSKSAKGVIRGLHYQIIQPQGKLVRVGSGKIFDVAVDIRASSPTFGKWVACELSAENHHMLWVPPGFAHGFMVLSDSAELIYKATDYYAPKYERCIRWNDPDVGVNWPLDECEIIVSEKDQTAPYFAKAEVYK